MALNKRAVAVIGTGTIGRSWVRAFTRAGYETRMWDRDPEQMGAAWDWLKADLKLARKRQGLRKAVARSQRELVTRSESLEGAVSEALYVQECGPEDLVEKRKLFAQLDAVADPKTILASSTAGFDPTAISGDLPGRTRCLLAHPLHLPHAVPAVEVCPGPETDPTVTRRTMRFLARIGQTPLLVRRFVPGLLADRLQVALLREATSLLASGVADLAALEGVVEDGLGLRWAILGPFGTCHTSAAGGIREYLGRTGPAVQALWADLACAVDFEPALVDRLEQAMAARARGAPLEEQRAWRDELIERVRRLRAAHPLHDGEGEGEG